MEKFTAAVRPVRPPARKLPRDACDCHFHVFGDPERFPQPDRRSNAFRGLAPIEDLLRVHRSLGITRGVFVQPWGGYNTDHSYLLEALSSTPRDHYVGTAIIEPTVSDRRLRELHDAGVRGTRLVMAGREESGIDADVIRRTIERIRALGWYLKLHVGQNDLAKIFDFLKDIDSVPLVFDHMCRVRASDGMAHPHVRRVVDLLRKENVWIILSNGYHFSAEATGWADMAGIGREFFRLAPERCIWGSDWPHMRDQNEGAGPEEAEILELLYRYLPDEAAIQAVLVDNPARLHGFKSDDAVPLAQ